MKEIVKNRKQKIKINTKQEKTRQNTHTYLQKTTTTTSNKLTNEGIKKNKKLKRRRRPSDAPPGSEGNCSHPLKVCSVFVNFDDFSDKIQYQFISQ